MMPSRCGTVSSGRIRSTKYLVREQTGDEWEVVRIGLAPTVSPELTAERGEPADAPEDPRPSLIRQIPPYGPPPG